MANRFPRILPWGSWLTRTYPTAGQKTFDGLLPIRDIGSEFKVKLSHFPPFSPFPSHSGELDADTDHTEPQPTIIFARPLPFGYTLIYVGQLIANGKIVGEYFVYLGKVIPANQTERGTWEGNNPPPDPTEEELQTSLNETIWIETKRAIGLNLSENRDTTGKESGAAQETTEEK